MDRFKEPSLWIEIGAVLVIGTLLLLVALRAMQLLAQRTHAVRLAIRPITLLVRWAGVLIIAGILVNKLFLIDVMNIIIGGLALVAIGVVAVWSLLSHMTATLLLVLLRPFRIYDWITFPGEDIGGRVRDLNLFFTLLDDEEGEHYIVPNNLFFQKTFRHVPGKGAEHIELHEQLQRTEPASELPQAPPASPPSPDRSPDDPEPR